MFTPHDRLTSAPARQSGSCMCARGGACSSFAPGHAVHLIQARLVSATSSEWADAIVVSAGPDGTLTLADFADGTRITVWNGAGAADEVVAGDPVAYHPREGRSKVTGTLRGTWTAVQDMQRVLRTC